MTAFAITGLGPKHNSCDPTISLLCVYVLSRFSCVRLFATLWTIARQAPLSMGLSRQEYWSELPCPPLGDRLNPGIKPTSLMSPALAGMLFTSSATCGASVEKQTRFTKRHAPDCSQQCCSQSPEMPINGRKEKCIAMCSHHGICHSKENECYTTSCHTMCEFHKDDVKDRSQKQEFCTVWFHQRGAIFYDKSCLLSYSSIHLFVNVSKKHWRDMFSCLAWVWVAVVNQSMLLQVRTGRT